MSQGQHAPIGAWAGGMASFEAAGVRAAAANFRQPAFVVANEAGGVGVALDGQVVATGNPGSLRLLGVLPPLYPEWLGDRTFAETHGTRFPYIAGAMANGIHTTAITIAMARAGMIGFFGAAGLTPERVTAALDELQATLDPAGLPWGSNLIHSPNEPDLEQAIVDLYLARGVRRVSAAAYMNLTPMVVRYAATGLTQDAQGRVVRRNFLFAKISRPEVAARFMGPAPAAILDALVAAGRLTPQEAALAQRVPVAEDITAESDSGGHTDNRPLGPLFAAIAMQRDQMMQKHRWDRPIRVGAAGGLGTPSAVAAAFQMGAAYVLTGTVNQACVESGLSETGRKLLAQAGIADVTMAPAADMFELGVDVQVLRRGTLFANRGRRLYELYQAYPSLEAIPADVRAKLETEIFQAPLDQVWADTHAFFSRRNPEENERAARDPKHRMALVFRSYLGQSSRWAIQGVPNRAMDYQIWCGPAMGSFNTWTADTHLAPYQNRRVVDVALNFLEGAAAITRAQQLRSWGANVPADAFDVRPRPLLG